MAAMLTEKTWEEETLALIEEARKEERRAEQRVSSAQKALGAARLNREALERSLGIYRRSYGVEEGLEIDPALAAEFNGKSIKEMLALWADKHEGEVVMNDIITFLTSARLFKDKVQASGALYSTAQRAQFFERVGRGVFHRVDTSKEQENGQNAEDGWVPLGDIDAPDYAYDRDGIIAE